MASHKYTPTNVIVASSEHFAGHYQVTSAESYPPETHPDSPIKNDLTAIELKTDGGSRWYGCERAYIDPSLRMVIVGYEGAESTNWERPNDTY